MPDYRRLYVPGGTVFLTVVTHDRRPLFDRAGHVGRLRAAIRQVKVEWPFDVAAAVVLPDHVHFLWTLPDGDADFPKRVGRMKALFTKAVVAPESAAVPASPSRLKHRERAVWQRRFWEHTIRDEDDFKNHLDYIHYNPVKHRLATCPHHWARSSFSLWSTRGEYAPDWGCSCDGRSVRLPHVEALKVVGE